MRSNLYLITKHRCFSTMLAKSFCCAVAVLFGLLSVKCIKGQTVPQHWGTAISHDGGEESAPLVLQLEMVSEGNPLIGKFGLERLEYRKQETTSPFVVEGHLGQDGSFWPNVQLEVKSESDGKWIKVASSWDAPVSSKLNVYFGMAAYGLYVDLQPFKACMGKYNYGRVVLRSGENTLISLEDLAKWSTGSRETKKSD